MCLDRQRVMTDLIAEDPHVAFAIKEVILLFVFILYGFIYKAHRFFLYTYVLCLEKVFCLYKKRQYCKNNISLHILLYLNFVILSFCDRFLSGDFF